MIKAGQVSVRCNKTSLDILRELVLLAGVVPGGVYLLSKVLAVIQETLQYVFGSLGSLRADSLYI